LKDDFQILLDIFPEMAQKFKLEDYIRAKMIYASRSFNLKDDEGLVPISDMINTDKTPN
jgi:hypothetical protein